jgi:hypothetical protein
VLIESLPGLDDALDLLNHAALALEETRDVLPLIG